MNFVPHDTNKPGKISEIIFLLSIIKSKFPLFIPNDVESYSLKISTSANIIRCYDNDRLIAFIAYYCNNPLKDIAYITMVVVHPDFSKYGVGGKLLQLAIEDARKIGFQRMQLKVHPKNLSAIRLYSRFGFANLPSDDDMNCMEISLRDLAP